MVENLEREFKITAEWIDQVGDSCWFLKKCFILVTPSLMAIQIHPKHLTKLQELFGPVRDRKTCLPASLPSDDRGDVPANPSQASKYHTAIGILQYVSADLPHAQYGIRHLSQFAANPSRGNVKELTHLIGFVQATTHWAVGLEPRPAGRGLIKHDHDTTVLEAYSDSDWSGCKKSRRSTSSSVLFWSGMLLHSSSRTQKSVTLSSSEAEYNSAVAATCDALYLLACLNHVSNNAPSKVYLGIDNSSARAIMSRSGVARMRHLQGKLLWCQQKVSEGSLVVFPVSTTVNPSDLGTKQLKYDRVCMLSRTVGMRDMSQDACLVSDPDTPSQVAHVQQVMTAEQMLQVIASMIAALQVRPATAMDPDGDLEE